MLIFLTCLCISTEEEMASGDMVAPVNGVPYNEVHLSQLYGYQFM